MKFFRARFYFEIFIVLLLLSVGYYYRDDFGRFFRGFLNRVQPCQHPITYSIASIDPRFGLTK